MYIKCKYILLRNVHRWQNQTFLGRFPRLYAPRLVLKYTPHLRRSMPLCASHKTSQNGANALTQCGLLKSNIYNKSLHGKHGDIINYYYYTYIYIYIYIYIYNIRSTISSVIKFTCHICVGRTQRGTSKFDGVFVLS